MHDITDAVFFPGVVPFSKQTTDTTTDMVLTNGLAVLRLQKLGKFKITNGAQELIDLIEKLLDQVNIIATALGTEPLLTNQVIYQNAANTLEQPAATPGPVPSPTATIKALIEKLRGV